MRTRLFIVLLVTVLVAGGLGLQSVYGAGGGGTSPLSVNVVNPLTRPVPVTLTNSSLSVEAAPVKIDTTANTVKVDSSAASPVAVQEVRQPVNLYGAIDEGTAFGGVHLSGSDDGYQVPDGKVLVITNVSAGATLYADPGVPLNFYISGQGVWPLPLFRNTGPDYWSYYGSAQCEIYLEAGQYAGVGIQTQDGGKPGGATNISGYLMDVAE